MRNSPGMVSMTIRRGSMLYLDSCVAGVPQEVQFVAPASNVPQLIQ